MRLGVIEAVSAAIDDLFDREQRDQGAGERDRRIEGCNGSVGGETEAAKAAKKVEVAKINERRCDDEYGEPDRELCDGARGPVHGFGKRRQIEVVVATGGNRGSDEDGVDEQR